MQITNATHGLSNNYHSKVSSKDEQRGDLRDQGQMLSGAKLGTRELQLLKELQSVDRDVRAHEAAHQAAGGGLAGPASFSYAKGPDSRMYAIAGEVPIRTQEGSTPEETMTIARNIINAAMAPSVPSPQDYRVAASALKMETEARAEAMRIRAEEASENSNQNSKDRENSDLNQKNSNLSRDFRVFIAEIYRQNSIG